MWPVERVITSSDWNNNFQFVEKVRILNDLNLTSEQFLDFGILAGSSLSRTIPLPQSEFSIKNIADLVRHHKSGISVCQNVRQEPPYKAQFYTVSFWKARLAVKFSLVLTTEGACVPLPTVITPQQQAFTVQDVPGDLEEIFSPRIPDELYFHICRGLVSAQVVGWLTSGMIIEQQPLLETGEYRRFIKDVITEGPTSPRCTTIALLADILHPDWSKRRIVSAYNSACAHSRMFTTTLTLLTLLSVELLSRSPMPLLNRSSEGALTGWSLCSTLRWSSDGKTWVHSKRLRNLSCIIVLHHWPQALHWRFSFWRACAPDFQTKGRPGAW